MGALAHSDRGAPGWPGETGPSRPGRTRERREAAYRAAPDELERARPGARSLPSGDRADRHRPATACHVPDRACQSSARRSQRFRPHPPWCLQSRKRERRVDLEARWHPHGRGDTVGGRGGGPCELGEIPASRPPIARVAAPPPRRCHPRSLGERLVRNRSALDTSPPSVDGSGCGREDPRGLPVCRPPR